MKKVFEIILMVLLMPIELVLIMLWTILWLITLPFDKVYGNAIQESVKKNLL